MKINNKHLFGGFIYHIQSTTVARNPLFYNKALCERFLEKLEYYLSPICKILHYGIDNTEFQLIVKLHSKKQIHTYWITKKAKIDFTSEQIPLVSHIFSKAMSDLLVSTVQHFNYHHQRKGGLIAYRFKRHLIKSKVELDHWLRKMDQLEPYLKRITPWKKLPTGYRLRKQRRERSKMKYRCARHFYKKKSASPLLLRCFRRIWEVELRACFENLPLLSINKISNRISNLKNITKHQPPP